MQTKYIILCCCIILQWMCKQFFTTDKTTWIWFQDKGNNLLIPLYGYPVAEGLSFPEFIRLPPVPLGQS